MNISINRNLQLEIKLGKKPLLFSLLKYDLIVIFLLEIISTVCFIYFLNNGLGLAYNDARSHLDIGRRVVEGLKPGLAQIGSVWLPLNHLLMVPTVWIDLMWHSGLSGAIQNMISFVATGLIIYKLLEKINVGVLGRIVGVAIFAANLNILYLQSTAMTELLLLATMTIGVYYLILWHKNDSILDLVKAAFWIMLSSLTRYDGWFLLIFACGLVFIQSLRKKSWQYTEGIVILFSTLAFIGVALWFLWNQLIFKDALYFIFGPFSAHTQQLQLREAGVLPTKGNILLSMKVYLYALLFSSYTYPAILGFIGAIVLWCDKKIPSSVRLGTIALTAPLFFNVLALFLGFSVLFVQGISGNTWFNVRYGLMLAPSIGFFVGYLVDRAKSFRWLIIGSLVFVLFFAFVNQDSVTLDDARVGSSQKNVTEVAGWLKNNAKDQKGFVLISAASHDAIIFSSGLPMKKFIHEGTGAYWQSAAVAPDRWARWIIMRTYDDNDLTYKSIKTTPGFKKFNLIAQYPFADIYEIKPEYISQLHTEPILGRQR